MEKPEGWGLLCVVVGRMNQSEAERVLKNLVEHGDLTPDQAVEMWNMTQPSKAGTMFHVKHC